MLSYNPIAKKVIQYRPLGDLFLFNPKAYDTIFYEIWNESDHMNEVVLGFTVSGDMYQLSPAQYDSYVKEDLFSAQTINKGAVLTAIANYKKQHNMKFEEY